MAKIKLTPDKVREIKRRIIAGESSSSIAKDYNVSGGHIRKIRAGLKGYKTKNARWWYIGIVEEDDRY